MKTNKVQLLKIEKRVSCPKQQYYGNEPNRVPLIDCRSCHFYDTEVKELYEEGTSWLVCTFDEKIEKVIQDMEKKGIRVKVSLKPNCPYCKVKFDLPKDFVGLIVCPKCYKASHIAV